jgi:hypothetical protein
MAATNQRHDANAGSLVIPTAPSDDRFLRGNWQECPASCLSEKGQWSGPLVLLLAVRAVAVPVVVVPVLVVPVVPVLVVPVVPVVPVVVVPVPTGYSEDFLRTQNPL